VPYDVIDVKLKIEFASVGACTGDLLQCVVKMADSQSVAIAVMNHITT